MSYPINPDCPWHGEPAPIEVVEAFNSGTCWRQFGTGPPRGSVPDALDFCRELVAELRCSACGESRPVFRPVQRVTEDEAVCPGCGTPCTPEIFHGVAAGSPRLQMTVGQLGLPAWDIVWARRGEQILGIEIAGDAARGDRRSDEGDPP